MVKKKKNKYCASCIYQNKILAQCTVYVYAVWLLSRLLVFYAILGLWTDEYSIIILMQNSHAISKLIFFFFQVR